MGAPALGAWPDPEGGESRCAGWVRAQKRPTRPLPAPLSPEVPLEGFHQPGIFNYSALLLSGDEDTLYVGAREAVFAVSALNVSQKLHEVRPVPGPSARAPLCGPSCHCLGGGVGTPTPGAEGGAAH